MELHRPERIIFIVRISRSDISEGGIKCLGYREIYCTSSNIPNILLDSSVAVEIKQRHCYYVNVSYKYYAT